ncbi:MAG TPA: hypothetical protein VM325_04995 [Alphaproteobacteria bacterium]|nr:hypothetical protein [Alphaproteobacteria bacterium]
MAKNKKAKKKSGAGKAAIAGKKTVKKLAKKIDAMDEDIGAARQSGLSLVERIDQGLETLASDLRKTSTGLEAHVSAVKSEAGKQIEAVRSEAARELTALKADMAKQVEAAKAEAVRLVEAVKSEAAALLADASQASDQAVARLKAELAAARTEIANAVKPSARTKPAGPQRPAPATRAKATASKPTGASAKTPLKGRPAANGGASKDDANA